MASALELGDYKKAFSHSLLELKLICFEYMHYCTAALNSGIVQYSVDASLLKESNHIAAFVYPPAVLQQYQD